MYLMYRIFVGYWKERLNLWRVCTSPLIVVERKKGNYYHFV